MKNTLLYVKTSITIQIYLPIPIIITESELDPLKFYVIMPSCM